MHNRVINFSTFKVADISVKLTRCNANKVILSDKKNVDFKSFVVSVKQMSD